MKIIISLPSMAKVALVAFVFGVVLGFSLDPGVSRLGGTGGCANPVAVRCAPAPGIAVPPRD